MSKYGHSNAGKDDRNRTSNFNSYWNSKLWKNKMEWISIRDRLPKEGVYLCADGSNDIFIATYIYGDFEGLESPRKIDATHWMPLPEPPNE